MASLIKSEKPDTGNLKLTTSEPSISSLVSTLELAYTESLLVLDQVRDYERQIEELKDQVRTLADQLELARMELEEKLTDPDILLAEVPAEPKKRQYKPVDKRLAPQEADVLREYVAYLDSNGIAPTRKEVAENLGLDGPSSIKHNLEKLQEKGYIDWIYRSARSVRILVRSEEEMLSHGN